MDGFYNESDEDELANLDAVAALWRLENEAKQAADMRRNAVAGT